jgi:steroid delta-isomerase-like uncharacterized protein
MSTEQNQAVIRRCFQELDRQNLDVLDDLCTPGYVAHFPGVPGAQTRDAIKPVWGQFFVAFPNLRHTIESIIAEGDRVVARLIIEGVHTGPFMGMPPTGRAISIGSINFFRFEGGAIAEQWIDYNALGMLQALGAIPTPQQGGA